METLTPVEVIQALKNGKEVEVKFGEHYEWRTVLPHQMLLEELIDPEHQFRLMEERITIGDVNFPKPIAEELPEETIYYYPSIECNDLFNTDVWRSLPMDYRLLQRGLIHLDVRDAIAHAKALIKISGGSVDD